MVTVAELPWINPLRSLLIDMLQVSVQVISWSPVTLTGWISRLCIHRHHKPCGGCDSELDTPPVHFESELPQRRSSDRNATCVVRPFLYSRNLCLKPPRFAACWTSVTAATFTILFVHPKWTKHPICSIGAQSIWVLLTWTFWLASAAVLNHAMPQLFEIDACQHLVYCGHIRAIFGTSLPHEKPVGNNLSSSFLRFRTVSRLPCIKIP
jgi:hypothetical protein